MSSQNNNNNVELQKRIQCYCINLDSKNERWEQMQEHFAAIFPDMERFPAVLGRSLEKYPDNVHDFSYRLHVGRRILPGEVGCYLSHLGVLQRFLESDREFALICEDDIIPQKSLGPLLENLLAQSYAWEFVRLHHYCCHKAIPCCGLRNDYRLGMSFGGKISSACYLVSRRGARRLLRKLTPVREPYDLALHHGWLGIREFLVCPSPIELSQESNSTSIVGERYNDDSVLFSLSSAFFHLTSRCKRYPLILFRLLRYKIFSR